MYASVSYIVKLVCTCVRVLLLLTDYLITSAVDRQSLVFLMLICSSWGPGDKNVPDPNDQPDRTYDMRDPASFTTNLISISLANISIPFQCLNASARTTNTTLHTVDSVKSQFKCCIQLPISREGPFYFKVKGDKVVSKWLDPLKARWMKASGQHWCTWTSTTSFSTFFATKKALEGDSGPKRLR